MTRALLLVGALLCACDDAPPAGSPESQPVSSSVASDRDSAPAGSPSPVRFTDVTQTAGLDQFRNHSGSPEQRFILESISAGVAWIDADSDGWLDLFFVDGTTIDSTPEHAGHRLLHSVVDKDAERRFVDVSDAAGIHETGWGMGVAVGDADNDGRPDLYVTSWQADRLFRNESSPGQPAFSRPDDAGLSNPSWGTSATFVDIDNDGRLDLYVANYLEFDLDNPPAAGNWCVYKGLNSFCGPEGIPAQPDRLFRQRPDGRFEDVSEAAGVAALSLPALGVIAGDFDDDGDQDLYVANDSEPNVLWRNDGDWRLSDHATRTGTAYSETGLAQAGMGVDAGDFDRDGDLDLYVTNFSDDVNTLYTNDGAGQFDDGTYAAGLGGVVSPFLGWSTLFVDVDNDAWLDLFVANGHVYPALQTYTGGLSYAQRDLLYRNEGGRFVESGLRFGLDAIAASRAAAYGDYDNDGDADLVVAQLNEQPRLWRNDGGDHNEWIGFRLQSNDDNRDAIGARLRLHAGGVVQTTEVQRSRGFHSQVDPRVRFGLGASPGVDSLVIRWPGGTRQVVRSPETRRYHTISDDGSIVTGVAVVPAGARAAAPPMAAEAPTSVSLPDTSGWDADRFALEAGRFYASGQYAAAIECLHRAITLEPAEPSAYANLGLVYYAGLGDFEEAERVLRDGLVVAPRHPDMHRLLGQTLLGLNQPVAAVDALTTARQLAPQSAEVAGWLGLAHERAGKPSLAIDAYQQAVGLAPWDPRPHLNLARLHERQGRLAAAQSHRERFHELAPVQSRVDHYRRKTREYPDNAGAPLLLAHAYEEQGRVTDAARSFSDALRRDESIAAAHHGLGRALQQLGRLSHAISALERAHELSPDQAGILGDLGQAYHYQKRYADAVAAYRQANAIDDSIPTVHANMAMALAMDGQLPAAAAAFRRSLQLDASQPEARDGLAQVLIAQGDTLAAAQQWRTLLRDHPSHVGAQRGLRRIDSR